MNGLHGSLTPSSAVSQLQVLGIQPRSLGSLAGDNDSLGLTQHNLLR